MTSTSTDSCSSLHTQELLVRAQGGNAGALNEIYSRYRSILLVEIRSRLRISLARAEQAEDVLHTAFVSVFEDLHKLAYQGPGKFRRWLKRVVVHETIDLLRREEGRAPPQLSLERDPDIPPILDQTDHGPSEEVSRSESKERLLDCLLALSEEDRDLFVLRVIDELPFARISDLLEIPCTTVFRRYAAIVKRLRSKR